MACRGTKVDSADRFMAYRGTKLDSADRFMVIVGYRLKDGMNHLLQNITLS